MTNSNDKQCPSNKCKTGSKLLGIRQENGTIAILPQPLHINEQFIESVSANAMAPEQRFRFVNKCVEKGCSQWDGKGCGVINRVVSHLNDLPSISEIPKCGIRDRCRWFSQHSFNACKVCRFVITEITEEQILDVHLQNLSIEEIRQMVF